MGSYTRCQIVTAEKLQAIPAEIVHFVNQGYTYFPVPINHYDIVVGVRSEFGRYETMDEMIKDKSSLSKETLGIVELVEKLGISTFVVEGIDHAGDSYPPFDFLQFVIKDNTILKESTLDSEDENGYLYCESVLGYGGAFWDVPFESYDYAVDKYLKQQTKRD